MKRELLGFVFLFFCLNAWAADFAGTYKCKGHDPYLNKDYAGTIVVKPKNTVYQITMQYDTDEYDIGTGGPYDENLLSVVFQDTKNLKHIGLEQYRFSDDKKKIGGFWVYLGEDKLGTEICERVEAKVV